jgi:hypothetical protein
MDIDNSDLDMILNRFRTMNTNDKDHLITEFKRLSNTQLSTEGCCFYLDLAEWNLNTALWAYYEYENAAAAAGHGSAAAAASLNANPAQSVVSNVCNAYANEVPEMQFLCDVTIGEGESVHPGTSFIKTWRIKNSGAKRWPSDCKLKFVNGYNFSQSSGGGGGGGVGASSTSSTSSLTSDSSSSTTTASHNNPNGELVLLGANDSPVSIEVRELEPQEMCDLSISLKAPRQCGIYQCQYRMFTALNQPFGDPIWLLLNVEEGGVLGITQQLNSVSMFGNWNTNGSNQAAGSTHVNSNENSFSKSPFKFDSNSNLISYEQQQQQQLQLQHQQQHAHLNATGGLNEAEEKRPDFYDDMFS